MNLLRSRRLRCELAQRVRLGRAAAVAAVFFFASHDARATTINITDGAPTYFASVPACSSTNPVKSYVNCTNNSHLDDVTVKGDNAEFKKSFDAWNATNAAGSKWTFADGGMLPGGDFNVTIFQTFATAALGGVEISVDWTYAGADKGDYKWAQGLYDNYLLDGSIVAPFYEMDIMAVGCDNTNLLKQCPPLYPFQYADRRFYDKPQAPWPNSFFEANAFLSKADSTARTLTIYEGVNYGFQLDAQAVPEPGTLFLMVPGVLGFLALKKRWAGSNLL
jgi:hypothetical protein